MIFSKHRFSKLFLVTLSALAMSACGGGGNDNDNPAPDKQEPSEIVQPTTHSYYTLDYAPGGDYLSAHTTTVPHFEAEGELKLGNSTLSFKDVDGELVVDGYRYLMVGEDFTPDEGGMVFCKDDTEESVIWHAVLPAKATAVTGSVGEKVAKLVTGNRYTFFGECKGTNEVFIVHADGSMSIEVGGVPAEGGATPAQVKEMLADAGWNRHDAEDKATITSWLKVYEEQGRVFVVIIDQFAPDSGDPTRFEIMIMVQEEAKAG